MKQVIIFALVLFIASARSILAAEKIDEFLGLQFGSNRDTAKEAMVARGFKLKDDKAADSLTFQEGIYGGQPVTQLKLDFAEGKFCRATVAFEIRSGKREECARLGLEAYDGIRKALTEKYGPPATSSSLHRQQILAGKTPVNTTLKVVWRTQVGSSGAKRSITLNTVTMALYSWVFNVLYEDGVVPAAPGRSAPRNDV